MPSTTRGADQPFTVHVALRQVLAKRYRPVSVSLRVKVAISGDKPLTQNAAERLLDRDEKQIRELVEVIVRGEVETLISRHTAEEIREVRERFHQQLWEELEPPLARLGLAVLEVRGE